MVDDGAIRQLIQDCERLCPCFVWDLAMRSGCVVLSFNITVPKDKAACKAICDKMLEVAKDWVKKCQLIDPVSESSPRLFAQAWDYFSQIREDASDTASINTDTLSTDTSSSKALKPRLSLPTPSLVMPPPPPRALSTNPQSHRSSMEVCTIRDLELEVWVQQSGSGPDWEVKGWEGQKDSPEEDRDAEGTGTASQHMRLLACTQGRFLVVRVLGRELKGDALVLKVRVALPARVLASRGCPLALQLWHGRAMLCSTIAALLPQTLADAHTQLSTWVSHEHQQLLRKQQLLQQRKQLLLQQREAMQQLLLLRQGKQQVQQQLEQLEQGPDSGVKEFLADLAEWLRFQGGYSSCSSSGRSSCSNMSSMHGSSHDGVRHASSSTADGRSSQQSEAVWLMQDTGLDLLLHSLRYGLEQFAVALLHGLASAPFNLSSAAIASEPAFHEDPHMQKALAAAATAAATASVPRKTPLVRQTESAGGGALQQQQQQRQRQQQQFVSEQASLSSMGSVGTVPAHPPTHEKSSAEIQPCPPTYEKRSAEIQPCPPLPSASPCPDVSTQSYSSWLICQNRVLVAKWALLGAIAGVALALNPGRSRRTLPYCFINVVVQLGVSFAALRGMHKEVRLLVMCLATLGIVLVNDVASSGSHTIFINCGMDICHHLVSTVPFMLILEPSLSLLPILPMANMMTATKLYRLAVGHALPMAFFRASAIQALALAVYAIIRKKARALYFNQQANKESSPQTKQLPTDRHASEHQ